MAATAVLVTPTIAPTRHAYRPDIDGLRAIAILSVVLHHAGVPFIPGGFTGVDIFFVISGYLIGGQIYANVRNHTFSYLRFYQHRARRILPAFYTVLLFTIAAALILLSPAELRIVTRDAFAATLSASNLSFWRFASYFDARSSLNPLLMTWSLGVEEQFYLVIPLLIALLTRMRPRFILPTILIACALSLLLATHDVSLVPIQAFYLLPDRAWELGIGVALAIFEFNRRPSSLSTPLTHIAAFIGLALILAPFFILNPHSAFPGIAALPSVLGTAILIALPASLINTRLLTLAPLVFIGQISYSWYLWHWPILAFLRIATNDALSLTYALIAITAAFALAVLSWRFIEQPFRRSTTPPSPLLLRYAGASLALLAASATIYLAHGIPQRYPDLASIEPRDNPLLADPCIASPRHFTPNLSPTCYPIPSNLPIVAIWGDSHAAAIAPAIRALANARGYAFAEIVKSSCTPLIGASHILPRVPNSAARCGHFNRATLALIQSNPHIRVVVLTASWSAPLALNWMDGWLTADSGDQPILDSPSSFSSSQAPSVEANLRLYRTALATTVRALQSVGKEVILIQDTPSFAIDPLMLVRTANIPARRALALALSQASPSTPNTQLEPGFASPESTPAITASQLLILQASLQLSTQLYDPKPALCTIPTQCAYREKSTLLFLDSTHISPAGATRAFTNFPLPTASYVVNK